jgi:hypothetical protein
MIYDPAGGVFFMPRGCQAKVRRTCGIFRDYFENGIFCCADVWNTWGQIAAHLRRLSSAGFVCSVRLTENISRSIL